MKQKRRREVIDLTERAIKRHEKFIEGCHGNVNPQVLEMKHRNEGIVIGLRCLFDVLARDDLLMLRIEARGSLCELGEGSQG